MVGLEAWLERSGLTPGLGGVLVGLEAWLERASWSGVSSAPGLEGAVAGVQTFGGQSPNVPGFGLLSGFARPGSGTDSTTATVAALCGEKEASEDFGGCTEGFWFVAAPAVAVSGRSEGESSEGPWSGATLATTPSAWVGAAWGGEGEAFEGSGGCSETFGASASKLAKLTLAGGSESSSSHCVDAEAGPGDPRAEFTASSSNCPMQAEAIPA